MSKDTETWMTHTNEVIRSPLYVEVINTAQKVDDYKNSGLWSWEPDLNLEPDQIAEVLASGLDRTPIGFLPIGLRKDNQPLAITVFKRYSPAYQDIYPVLVPDNPTLNENTVLTLRNLSDLTKGNHVIELADTHLAKKEGKLGLYTPLRYGKYVLSNYLDLVRLVKSKYPGDNLMTVPMGVFPWTPESEAQITDNIKGGGGSLTVREYITRYNVGEHQVEHPEAQIGKVRSLSKMSEWLTKKAGFNLEIKGYTPGDFGWICLDETAK